MYEVRLNGKVVYKTNDVWDANLKRDWLIFEGHNREEICII